MLFKWLKCKKDVANSAAKASEPRDQTREEPENPSRRNFLKKSSSATAGVVIGNPQLPEMSGFIEGFLARRAAHLDLIGALVQLGRSITESDEKILAIGNARYAEYRTKQKVFGHFTEEQMHASNKAFYDGLRPEIEALFEKKQAFFQEVTKLSPAQREELIARAVPVKQAAKKRLEWLASASGKGQEVSLEEWVESMRSEYLYQIRDGSNVLTSMAHRDDLTTYTPQQLAERTIAGPQRQDMQRLQSFRRAQHEADTCDERLKRERKEQQKQLTEDVTENLPIKLRTVMPREVMPGYIVRFELEHAGSLSMADAAEQLAQNFQKTLGSHAQVESSPHMHGFIIVLCRDEKKDWQVRQKMDALEACYPPAPMKGW